MVANRTIKTVVQLARIVPPRFLPRFSRGALGDAPAGYIIRLLDWRLSQPGSTLTAETVLPLLTIEVYSDAKIWNLRRHASLRHRAPLTLHAPLESIHE
jgi:hypothetical protein